MAVQAGPEGAELDSKRDMFEGQEEVRLTGAFPRDLATRLTPAPHPQERKAWWPRLRDYMGKDIMSLMSVPVFIMARDKAPSHDSWAPPPATRRPHTGQATLRRAGYTAPWGRPTHLAPGLAGVHRGRASLCVQF